MAAQSRLKITKEHMKRLTFVFAALAVLLVGCWQKSLHPFYRVGDLAPDKQLIGRWETTPDSPDEDPERWRFRQLGPDSYTLEFLDSDGKKYRYVAHLFKLEEKRFLDLAPPPGEASGIPAHYLFLVSELGATFVITPLSHEWMRDFLTAHPHALPHARMPDPEHRDKREHDELILTADTEALQDFLRRHWDERGFFDDPITFEKQQP